MTTASPQPIAPDDAVIRLADGTIRYRGVSAPLRAVILFVSLGALFFAFTYQGFALLMDRWDSDSNYGHGYLIPFIALYFVWASRERPLSGAPAERNDVLAVLAGLALVLLGGILAVLGAWGSWSLYAAAGGVALLGWQLYQAWSPSRDFAGVATLLGAARQRAVRAGKDVAVAVPVRLTAILLDLKPKPWLWGLLVLLPALPMLFLALPLSSAVLAGLAIVLLANGVMLYLGGPRVYRALWFPVVYLVFMVPLPQGLHNALANPLQHFASMMSSNIMDGVMNIPVTRDGNVINVPESPSLPSPHRVHPLQVAEACSGMRSIMGLLALGIAFAWFWERPLWERIFLVGSTIPIAIVANIGRVTGTGVMYYFGHERLAQGIYHELTGWSVFVFAMVVFLIEVWVLDRIFVHEASKPAASGPAAAAGGPAGGRA